jgi:class 3 adenylate cyclase
MLSALGDSAWKVRLESYYRVVRSELAHYRGRETNTAGDGIMASFDGPGRAIRCALAIASAVKPLGLQVRAGLHTGEVAVMGDNIGGIAVHVAARVQSEAAPGEVIVSSTTKDLVAGSGIAFEPRGSRALKGVPSEWALFAATG